MGSSDGDGLPQLYLELVDGHKKRFMPQNASTSRRMKVLSKMEENEKK